MDNACPLLVMVVFLVLFSLPVAPQARRRGYSQGLWLLASVVVVNPIVFLIMLALMPNRARIKLREKYRAELAAKLAARQHLPPVSDAAGLPAASTQTISRSLGDLPTFAPRDKSLGDEETRGA